MSTPIGQPVDGFGVTEEIQAVLALMDVCDAEIRAAALAGGADEDEDWEDMDGVWTEEIERRVAEIHDGTTPTYAAEDVIAAVRIRFG